MFIILLLIFSFVIFIYSNLWLNNRNAFRRRRLYFTSRPELEYAQWFNLYFKEIPIDFEIAKDIMGRLAKNIKCHPTQLYPSDSFSRELKFTGVTLGLDLDDEVDIFIVEDLPLFFYAHGISKKVEEMMSESKIDYFDTLKDVLIFCNNCLHKEIRK